MLWLLLSSAGFASPCGAYGPTRPIGMVTHAALDESSGIVASRTRDGIFFTHNDSGGAPEVYAFTSSGDHVEAHAVQGAQAVDWEDIAAGPCPTGGDCLFLADIGDNKRVRPDVQIYVVEEPAAGAHAPVVARWSLRYEDGPHNAEALLLNPITRQLRIVTKTKSGTIEVFAVPVEPGVGTMTKVSDLWPMPEGGSEHKITGGDWSADGSRVVLRTYNGLWEWQVDANAPDSHWSRAPRLVGRSTEEQGEAVGYRLDGGLITTSEGQPMPVSGLDCTEVIGVP